MGAGRFSPVGLRYVVTPLQGLGRGVGVPGPLAQAVVRGAVGAGREVAGVREGGVGRVALGGGLLG
jgi:hypothetical protein